FSGRRCRICRISSPRRNRHRHNPISTTWRVVGGTHESDPRGRYAGRSPDTAANISAPRMRALATHPILAAPVGRLTDPRIAAGFTVATAPAHATLLPLLSNPTTINHHA